jgi:hypothetical protein
MPQTENNQTVSSTAMSSFQIKVPVSRSESATPPQVTTKQRPEISEGPIVVVEQPPAETRQKMSFDVFGTDETLWETLQGGVSPPELSYRVQKLSKRPHFEGTYSRVYCGEYKGKKVSMFYSTSSSAKNKSQVAIKEIRSVKSKRVTDRVSILAKCCFNIKERHRNFRESFKCGGNSVIQTFYPFLATLTKMILSRRTVHWYLR